MKAQIILILISILIFGCDSSPSQVRFDKQSEFERVLVIDEGERRYLRFGSINSANQSIISLSDDKAVPMEYIRIAALSVILTPNLNRALMIGLGGGNFTTLLRRHFPELYIDAVEIDPVVVQAAKGYFGVKEDQKFRIYVEDGAKFIQETRTIYDLIFIDAYSGEGIPKVLSSTSFFDAVKEKVSANGTIILNLHRQKEREISFVKLLQTRFPETACIRSSDNLNLVLFGKRSTMPDRMNLISLTKAFSTASDLSFNLEIIAKKLNAECNIAD
jgi:spermidine synthase